MGCGASSQPKERQFEIGDKVQAFDQEAPGGSAVGRIKKRHFDAQTGKLLKYSVQLAHPLDRSTSAVIRSKINEILQDPSPSARKDKLLEMKLPEPICSEAMSAAEAEERCFNGGVDFVKQVWKVEWQGTVIEAHATGLKPCPPSSRLFPDMTRVLVEPVTLYPDGRKEPAADPFDLVCTNDYLLSKCAQSHLNRSQVEGALKELINNQCRDESFISSLDKQLHQDPSVKLELCNDPAKLLPLGWETGQSPEGRSYYIDHSTGTTHWEPPPRLECVYLVLPAQMPEQPTVTAEMADNQDFTPLGSTITRITGAHNRAIQVRQLRRLREFIVSHEWDEMQHKKTYNNKGELCWIDPPPYGSGKRIRVEKINLYQINQFVIIPSTKAHSCSFVELICDGQPEKQKPRYFVSHWWGEPVMLFIKAVERHAEIRCGHVEDLLSQLEPSPDAYVADARIKEELKTRHAQMLGTAYWVCAYANNQHELSKDMDSNPLNSSFFLAMSQSDGVLLVLDDKATAFTRIWCMFEEAMVMQVEFPESKKGRLTLDIATVTFTRSEFVRGEGSVRVPYPDGEAQVITDGLTDLEEEAQKLERNYYDSNTTAREEGSKAKAEREKFFPLELIARGYRINVATANASVERDKQAILNTITKVPVDQLYAVEPDLNHEEIKMVNRSLQHVFVEAWMRSTNPKPESGWPQALSLLADGCTTQELEISHVDPIETTDSFVNLAMVKSLEEFRVNLDYQEKLHDLSGLGQGLSGLDRLRRCIVKISSCKNVTDLRPLTEPLGQLPGLQELEMDVGGMTVESLCFTGLHQLKALSLNCMQMGYENKVRKVPNKRPGYPPREERYNISSVSDVSDLAQLFINMPSLESLELNLQWNYSIDTFAPLCSIRNLKSLRRLQLFLGHNDAAAMDEVGAALGELTCLEYMYLHYEQWRPEPGPGSLESHGASLGRLHKLRHLEVRLETTGCLLGLTSFTDGLIALKPKALRFARLTLTDVGDAEGKIENVVDHVEAVLAQAGYKTNNSYSNIELRQK